MPKSKIELLMDQLKEIMKNGSEKDVRDFIVDHMPEFPEKVREKLTFLFFQEGLAKLATGKDKELFEFQKEGLKAFKEIKKETDEMEDQYKIEQTKKAISE